MSVKKIGLVAAVVVASGAIVVGGAALANAATGTPTPSASEGARGNGGPGGSADTPVTGDELARVTAAVTTHDSTVTVTSVRKDPDGSYDVFATKSGNPVGFEVSADLKTITDGGPGSGHGGPGGGGPGHGGPGGSADNAVTGAELAKVTAAMTAKDSTVTVGNVHKDPDGSYDVFGTRSGNPVMYEVSADLKTITQSTFAPGGGRGPGGGPGTAPAQ